MIDQPLDPPHRLYHLNYNRIFQSRIILQRKRRCTRRKHARQTHRHPALTGGLYRPHQSVKYNVTSRHAWLRRALLLPRTRERRHLVRVACQPHPVQNRGLVMQSASTVSLRLRHEVIHRGPRTHFSALGRAGKSFAHKPLVGRGMTDNMISVLSFES